MSSTDVISRAAGAAPVSAAEEEAVYAKVTRRLLPFLMLCYVIAYLDRVNVGFAKLQMLDELGFSEAVYGLGAGIFFLGYFLFEVPSNVIMHRVGARIWIGRIMITWGLISGAFVFVKTVPMFYFLRFLLGLAEAGFYPGIILYLTYWFPSSRRGAVTAIFMTAIPVSGIIGGPLSGWIMASFHGSSGWSGWQWMFLIEAIPSILIGIVTIAFLDSSVASARWLTDREKAIIAHDVAHESHGKPPHRSLGSVFADRRIWLLCLIYFAIVMGQYGLTLWMPTLVQAAGIQGVFHIGLLTAVPYIAAVVSMVIVSRRADRRRERRWHTVGPMVVGGVGLVLTALAGHHTWLAMLGLTIAAAGAITSGPLFWSLPTAFLGGVSAAAGIATINSVGNLAGFVSPSMVGVLRDLTGRTELSMFVLAAILVAGAGLVLTLPARLVDK